MKNFILTLFFLTISTFVFQAVPEQFMRIARDFVIVDNQRCFQIRKGYSRGDLTPWEPFCGKLANFSYEQGFEYTVRVVKYSPEAPVIEVINTVGCNNSGSYRKHVTLKRKKVQTLAPQQLKEMQASIDALPPVRTGSQSSENQNKSDER